MLQTTRRLFVSAILFVSLLNHMSAQKAPQQKEVNYSKFLMEYHAKSLAPEKMTHRNVDTLVHPYAVVSTHFVQEKVYADRDALSLLQALNPKIRMDDPNTRINAGVRLVTPHYIRPSALVLAKFDRDYAVAAATDPALNATFSNSVSMFNDMINRMALDEKTRLLGGLWDSLTLINSNVLPVFNQHSSQISQAQMLYLNDDVTTLVRLFNSKKKSPNKSAQGKKSDGPDPYRDTQNDARKSFIVKDLIDLSNITDWSSGKSSGLARHSGGVAYHRDYYHGTVASLGDRPFKCNVYVFKTDPNNPAHDADPVQDNFYLWLGTKARFDDLIPGCDSSSLGYPKNGNLASTLPVAIGFGSFIIIIQDKNTGDVFVKEVSTSSETVFERDDKDVRKIIFNLQK